MISGDIPQDMSRKMYPSDVLDVIKKFKKEIPGIKIYAAFDPYRREFTKNWITRTPSGTWGLIDEFHPTFFRYPAF